MQDEEIPDDLAGRLRRVAEVLGLKQQELADLMGVNLDRVKSLFTGKVKKMAPEELQALEEKRHVRPQYLVRGEGAPLKPREEIELLTRLSELGRATKTVAELEVPDWVKRLAQEWLFAIERGDSTRIQQLAAVAAAPRAAEPGAEYAAARIDDQLLTRVCEAVIREIQAQAVVVSPAKQAELIAAVYEASCALKAVNPATVKRLVRLAA